MRMISNLPRLLAIELNLGVTSTSSNWIQARNFQPKPSRLNRIQMWVHQTVKLEEMFVFHNRHRTFKCVAHYVHPSDAFDSLDIRALWNCPMSYKSWSVSSCVTQSCGGLVTVQYHSIRLVSQCLNKSLQELVDDAMCFESRSQRNASLGRNWTICQYSRLMSCL